jgi:hypothetical protein
MRSAQDEYETNGELKRYSRGKNAEQTGHERAPVMDE